MTRAFAITTVTASGLVIALECAAGCAFNPPGAAGGGDAAVDPGIDAPMIPDSLGDACVGDVIPFPPANLPPGCELPTPSDALVIGAGDWTLDTDVGTLSGPQTLPLTTAQVPQAGAPDILAVVATLISIGPGATVEVRGARALALVSTSSLTVRGKLDGSARGNEPGPGGDHPGACAIGTGADGEVQDAGNPGLGGSGGGGGGFGTAGGTGASVDGAVDPPSAGGDVSGIDDLVPLRGGCGGGDGGLQGGVGGGGGGAIQLVAAQLVDIRGNAVVSVSGAGGVGAGRNNAGGGGGGSGGGLLIEAPEIILAGAVTANGGGGGGGRRSIPTAQDGDPGSADTGLPADGGLGASNGGNGGAGAAGSGTAGEGTEGTSSNGAAGAAGGGGGGGGTGRLHTNGAVVLVGGAVISPPRVACHCERDGAPSR